MTKKENDSDKPLVFALLLSYDFWLGLAIIILVARKFYYAYPIRTLVVSSTLVALLLVFKFIRQKKN